jgi:hypothetical protein
MSSIKTKILAVTAGVLLAAVQAGATGTASGTTVNNQATVDYTVGTVNQPDVNSNTDDFRGRPARPADRRRGGRRVLPTWRPAPARRC